MPSNYTGNPTATQPPAAQPGAGVAPIIVLPADTDPNNVATMFNQQYKMLADYGAYAMNFPTGVVSFKSLFIDSTGGSSVTPVSGTLRVSGLGSNAGVSTGINLGTLYKDSTPIAWAFVDSVNAVFRQSFNMTAVGRDGFNATGCFSLTLGTTQNAAGSWGAVATTSQGIQNGISMTPGYCITTNGTLAAGPTFVNPTTTLTVRTFGSGGSLVNLDFFVICFGK